MAEYDFDDDMDFNSEQVKLIASNACNLVFQNDAIVYQKEKASQWCQQIIDSCLKELAKLGKDYKYVVTCILQQNIGSGLQSAAGCHWDTKNDGMISVLC